MEFSKQELANYLKAIRESLDYSIYDVNKLCDISPSYLSLMENGKRRPSPIILKKLSSIYGIEYNDLLTKAGFYDLIEDKKNTITNSNSAVVLVYGTIPAGIPMECMEDILDTEEISADMLRGGKQYFGLRVKGDSMNPEYLDGDTLILEKVDDCENGQDCVVMVNGDDGTFKRVYKTEQGIILQPLNPQYPSMIYTNEQIQKLPVRIIGKVVELRRKK